MPDKLKKHYNKYILGNKKLCLIANPDSFENEDDFLNAAASSLNGGVDIIQFSGHSMPSKKFIELGKKVKLLCAEYNVVFIIHDRADIAFILDADGIHLEQDSMDIIDVRKILGDNAVIGVSTQDLNQIKKAENDGADYIFVNPDMELTRQNLSVPCFACGNINIENICDVIKNGISKAVVSDEIIKSENPEHAAKMFLSCLS